MAKEITLKLSGYLQNSTETITAEVLVSDKFLKKVKEVYLNVLRDDWVDCIYLHKMDSKIKYYQEGEVIKYNGVKILVDGFGVQWSAYIKDREKIYTNEVELKRLDKYISILETPRDELPLYIHDTDKTIIDYIAYRLKGGEDVKQDNTQP